MNIGNLVGFIIVLNGISNFFNYFLISFYVGFIIVLNGISNYFLIV